jgi:hypothetical protein
MLFDPILKKMTLIDKIELCYISVIFHDTEIILINAKYKVIVFHLLILILYL